MGFDIAQVISDDNHYSPFVCSVCENLVSLDAVVTQSCSHAFCRTCLATVASESRITHQECTCPACATSLSVQESGEQAPEECADSTDAGATSCTSSSSCVELGGVRLAAQPLETSQPLAFTVLCQIQVACIDFTHQQCSWCGDYGDFLGHAAVHGHEAASKAFVVSSDPILATPVQQSRNLFKRSLNGLRSVSMPNIVSPMTRAVSPMAGMMSPGEGSDGGTFVAEEPGADTPASHSRRTMFRKAKSLRGVEVEGDQPISLESLKCALTLPAYSVNESISTDPVPQKPPTPSKRTNERNEVFKRQAQNTIKASLPSDDLEGSYSQHLDLNTSISSLGGWNNSFNEKAPPMETLEEDLDNLDIEATDDEDSVNLMDLPVEQVAELLEMAEKLRKQANAKFNKGDFTASRVLYTEGIDIMHQVVPSSPKERELMANLYSNRAVTYFREKRFEHCVKDCDTSIQSDPSYDKSWIRKWRALMALGNFDAAYDCLELAITSVRDPTRVQGELSKARQEKELITTIRNLLEDGDYIQAKETLKPHARSSDNIGLLFLAARADCGLGHTESALEKVNKALRFNPTHTEGLELRGYALFLAGEAEKGAHLLQEAYNGDKENKEVRLKLLRCQKTHSAFGKGRSAVKRGRYKEAVDHFTAAITESGEVPTRSPLFGALRTERAEALLLSKRHLEALKDCQVVIDADAENATAWAVRAEVLVAMDRTDEAKNELDTIRRTWGWDNPTIDEGYKRVDFELRVQTADEDLMQLVSKLQAGTFERLMTRASGSTRTDLKVPDRQVQPRKSDRAPKSNGDQDRDGGREKRQGRSRANIHRKPENGRSKSKSRRKRRSSSRSRRASNSEGEPVGSSTPRSRSRSKSSRVRRNGNEGDPDAPTKTKSGRKTTFVPPPTIESMTGDTEGGSHRHQYPSSPEKLSLTQQRGLDRKSRRQSFKRTESRT